MRPDTLTGPEGQLALPTALGEDLGLDDLAVVLEAPGLEDVLELHAIEAIDLGRSLAEGRVDA